MSKEKQKSSVAGRQPSSGSTCTHKSYTNFSSIPTHEIQADFERVVIENAGCLPRDGLDLSGGLQRFWGEGDKRGSKNWFSVAHIDGVPTLHLGNFKDGTSFNHTFNIGRSLTPSELKEQKRIAKKSQQEREREAIRKNKETEQKAIYLWSNQFVPASADIEFLQEKHMLPDGLKQTKDKDLVVPIFNNRRLSGLQFINLKSKRFMSGSKLAGSYFLYKPANGLYDEIFLSEGISTACAIWQLTRKKASFAAFSSGNLESIALKIRREFPRAKLTICCDNDIRKDSKQINTGVHYGTLAANKTGAFLAIPELNNKKCDFCDVWCNAVNALKGGAA